MWLLNEIGWARTGGPFYPHLLAQYNLHRVLLAVIH